MPHKIYQQFEAKYYGTQKHVSKNSIQRCVEGCEN